MKPQNTDPVTRNPLKRRLLENAVRIVPWRVAKRSPLGAMIANDLYPWEIRRDEERYEAFTMGGGAVFHLATMNYVEFIAILLANYRPGEIVNGFLRNHQTEADYNVMVDYLRRGGRPDQAICICPNIPKP